MPADSGPFYADPITRVHNFDPGNVTGGFTVPTHDNVTEDGEVVIMLSEPLGCEIDPAAKEATVLVLAEEEEPVPATNRATDRAAG